MAETALPSAAGRETPRGVIPELVGWSASFGRHFQALLQLAGIEGKEAAMIGLRLVIFLASPGCVPSLVTCHFAVRRLPARPRFRDLLDLDFTGSGNPALRGGRFLCVFR